MKATQIGLNIFFFIAIGFLGYAALENQKINNLLLRDNLELTLRLNFLNEQNNEQNLINKAQVVINKWLVDSIVPKEHIDPSQEF